jgi:hypothetical protein
MIKSMHEYNTSRKELFLKEYGRNIQSLVDHIGTIADKATRTQYAQSILRLMGTLSSNGKNVIEYTQKRWDDLFIISDYTLDIDGDHVMPTRDALVKRPVRLEYYKQPVKYRHYGRHIELLVKKVVEITDPVEQERAIINIAKLIKNFSSTWNKDNLDTNNILATIEDIAEGKLIVNLEKIKSENTFYLPSTSYKDRNKNYKKAKEIQVLKQNK